MLPAGLSQRGGRVCVIETEIETPHFETSLEIALQLASRGVIVDYFLVRSAIWGKSSPRASAKLGRWGALSNMWPFSSIELRKKPGWLLRRVGLWANVNSPTLNIRNISKAPASLPKKMQGSNTLEGLRRHSVNGFPVGSYLSSSLISLTTNGQVSPMKFESLLVALKSAFWRAHAISSELLSSFSYDAVILFNGRFAESGGILLACQEHNVETWFHERGGFGSNKFFLERWRPQHMKLTGLAARKFWESLSPDQLIAASREAEKVFEEARENGGLGAHFYSPERLTDSLVGVKTAVFFTSSEDEYESIAEVIPDSVFQSQLEAITEAWRSCSELGLHLIVRVHPHIRKKSAADRKRWGEDLERVLDGATIIRAEEDFDSYQLIDRASVVLVWNSTIGLESLYWGKPTITLAETPYFWTGADVIYPSGKNLTDEIAFACNTSPSPKTALPFAFFLKNHGRDSVFFNLNSGEFLGQPTPRTWQYERAVRKILKTVLQYLNGIATGSRVTRHYKVSAKTQLNPPS